MKTHELDFLEDALKEWRKLDGTIREQFKKKLEERLQNPHVPSARLSGMPQCYKIKLRELGYRLVYEVIGQEVVVVVVAVGKREKSVVYEMAAKRLRQKP